MKKPFLMKLSINVLILLSLIKLLGLVINIPLKKCILSPIKVCIVDWNLFYWFIAIISITSYFFFLKSLYHLRKIAKQLAKESLSDIIKNLKKSGTCLCVTGIIYSLIIIFLWIYQAIETGVVEIGYDMNLISPLFLITTGLVLQKTSKVNMNNG